MVIILCFFYLFKEVSLTSWRISSSCGGPPPPIMKQNFFQCFQLKRQSLISG
ncbi:hypothetical protein ACJW31_12G160900 [Castanea mollissima]